MIFSAEWTYLLTTRTVGGEDSAFSYVRLKYGENATDTVSGVIIYPDDFSFSEAGVASMAFGAAYRVQATINAADWEALENVGCIFLPGARIRSATTLLVASEELFGTLVYYWSASGSSAANASFVYAQFYNGQITPAHNDSRVYGMPVRLVQDLEK